MNPFGGMGLGLDPNSMNQLLQNPMIQNMMDQVFSNPEVMQQVHLFKKTRNFFDTCS